MALEDNDPFTEEHGQDVTAKEARQDDHSPQDKADPQAQATTDEPATEQEAELLQARAEPSTDDPAAETETPAWKEPPAETKDTVGTEPETTEPAKGNTVRAAQGSDRPDSPATPTSIPTEAIFKANAPDNDAPDPSMFWTGKIAFSPASFSGGEALFAARRTEDGDVMLDVDNSASQALDAVDDCCCPYCGWSAFNSADGSGVYYEDSATQTNPSPGNTLIAGIAGPNKWNETPSVLLTYAFSDGSTSDWDFFQDEADSTFWEGKGSSATHANLESGTGDGNNLSELRADVTYALDLFESWFDMSFSYSTSFDGLSTDLRIMAFEDYDAFGRAQFPGDNTKATTTASEIYETFIHLGTLETSNGTSGNELAMSTDPELGGGSNRLHTTMHEIMHALGFGHPHDGGNGTGTWTTNNSVDPGDNVLDNDRYTIMSYERAGLNTNNNSSDFGLAVTPMVLDLAGFFYLYGSAAHNTGTTTYTLTDPETVALDRDGSDGNVSIGRAFYAIHDTGGTDEIEYSGSKHVLINLNNATLNQASDVSRITNIIDDLNGSSLFDSLLPSATASELRNDLLLPEWHAGGFGSRIFNNSGVADLGGYYIAADTYADVAHRTRIENATGADLGDILIGNQVANNMVGNGGDDLMIGSNGNDSLYGDSGDDDLYGGNQADLLSGDSGDDYLNAGNGHDFLYGGYGSDSMYGGDGNDTLFGGGGIRDLYYGGSGDDDFHIYANQTSPITTVDFYGGDGYDQLFLRGGAGVFDFTELNISNVEEIVFNETGDSTMILSSKEIDAGYELLSVTIDGFSGGSNAENKVVVNIEDAYNSGNLDLSAWIFQDWQVAWDSIEIYGTDEDQEIIGTSQNDIIEAGPGQDTVYGGSGDDVFLDLESAAPSHVDVYYGGAGIDTVVDGTGYEPTVTFNLATGQQVISSGVRDLYYGIENLSAGGSASIIGSNGANHLIGISGSIANSANDIDGGNGNDTIEGGLGNDTLRGGGGVNEIYGDSGDDDLGFKSNTFTAGNIFDGGEGTDLFDYSAFSGNYEVNLGSGTFAREGGGSASTLASIENVSAGSGDDSIIGDSGDNVLYGGEGNDTIRGGIGMDTMFGGSGDDNMGFYSGNLREGNVFDGGDGIDVFSFSDFVNGYRVNLSTSLFEQASDGQYANTVTQFENIVAGFGNDDLTGTVGANSIVGSLGNDTINALAGQDTVEAGSGDDVIIDTESGSSANADEYFGGAGNDTLVSEINWSNLVVFNLATGVQTVLGSARDTFSGIENLTVSGHAQVFGDGQNNELIANDSALVGNNSIYGGSGDDTIAGGAGNDTLYGGHGTDKVLGESGDDEIGFQAGTMGAGNLFDGGDGNDTFRFDNFGSDYYVDLAAGMFRYATGGSANTVVNFENILGGNGNDELIGNSGANYIHAGGGIGADILNGGEAGDDTLIGGAGNDTLIGGAGADSMVGGSGDDTYYVDNVGDTIDDYPDEGQDLVIASISVDLRDYGQHVENLVLTGVADLDGIGNARDNTIIGNVGANTLNGAVGDDSVYGGIGDDTMIGGRGNDFLIGGTGADSMIGGSGDDTYYVDNVGDMIDDYPGQGHDLVYATVSVDLRDYGQHIEDLTLTGADDLDGTGNVRDNTVTGNSGHNDLDGNRGNDTLIGGAGNDTLMGGIGADSMVGGSGDDTYYIDNAGDTIDDYPDEGHDHVYSGISLDLRAFGQHLEDLTLTGTGDLDGTGNARDNTLTGTSGANLLEGKFGNDTLIGGAGNDTLDGGTDAESMVGGSGDDTYYIDNAGDTIEELLNEGIDQVYASVSVNLRDFGQHIENLTLTGSGDIDGAGNARDNILSGNGHDNELDGGEAGNDTLYGGKGNDTLIGGTGADSMVGGSGDDTYYVDDAGDMIDDYPDQGHDLVYATVSVDLRDYGQHVEDLTLTGTEDLTGEGNARDNTMTGNDGANSLDGAVGDDALYGGGDDDTLLGSRGNDTLDGGTGADSMVGGSGDDTYYVDDAGDMIDDYPDQGHDLVYATVSVDLRDYGQHVEDLTLTGSADLDGEGNARDNTIIGNAGDNALDGAVGDDTLIGGGGNDTMTGGSGVDTFQFNDPNDGVIEITDLDLGAGEQLSLNAAGFGAIVTAAGNALHVKEFHLGATATAAEHRILYDAGSGAVFYDADGNGGAGAVQFAQITAGLALTETDVFIF
ncbi:MAG: hypothetical protein ACPH5G_00745 [Pseudooceanicola atlanticus]